MGEHPRPADISPCGMGAGPRTLNSALAQPPVFSNLMALGGVGEMLFLWSLSWPDVESTSTLLHTKKLRLW